MNSAERIADPELESSPDGFLVPWWFRLIAFTLALALLIPPIVLIFRYSNDPSRFASVSNLGVVQLIIAGVVLLLSAFAPWKALGIRVRKVGIFEFDRVINTQAHEHIEIFAELRERILELETKIRGLDGVSPIAEHVTEMELSPILQNFLREFAPTAFSPLKISTWGSRQPGYEKLRTFTQGSIRIVLQKLVASGVAVTRVSELGNTLYAAAS